MTEDEGNPEGFAIHSVWIALKIAGGLVMAVLIIGWLFGA
jgi:hypothetical protein